MHPILSQPENSSNGFLCDFIEVRSLRPTDGLNGWCTIYYGNPYSKCSMSVKIEKGYRKGKAIIFNDGVPFIILFYQDGLPNGIVEKMNEYGMVALHGHLMNGIENGLFEEYDKNGKVIWRGYYRNGKQYQDVRGKIVKKGDDSEKSRETEEYYELDDNGSILKFCIYEKGVLHRVVMEFNGNVMTEYDMSGKRVYEGEYSGDMKTGFVREGKGREYGNGELAIYTGEWRNGKREGLGTEFRGSQPLYSGEWKEGKRHGNGREMDKRGNVTKTGRWRNGVHEKRIKIVAIPSSLTSDPMNVEKLEIPDGCFNISNITVLKLSNLLLQRVEIGDDCFGAVRRVEFSELSVLESVVIGNRSMTENKHIDTKMHYSGKLKGIFRIVDCIRLESVQIGEYSLSDFTSFEVKNLPSLQCLETDAFCFYFVASFALIGLALRFA